jgi:hypothetical protein
MQQFAQDRLIDGSSVEVDFGKDVFYSPYTPARVRDD